jgi:Holliday junction resolvasome RuvABC endonuclease subunit
MGVVVIRGLELLSYGVHTLRNGTNPHNVIGQAKRVVLEAIARHQPQIVAIEEPLMLATKRAALMSVIVQELRSRAEELSLEVVELSPRAIRQAVVGSRFATKLEVAEAVTTIGSAGLSHLVPRLPARSALGFRPRDKYWLHMFDALAAGRAAQLSGITGTTPSALLSEPPASANKKADPIGSASE